MRPDIHHVTYQVTLHDRREVHEFANEEDAREFAREFGTDEPSVWRVIHYNPSLTTRT